MLHNFNYGGTIAGLYDAFMYIKDKKEYDSYLLYFEEDFYPFNLNFLEESLKYLSDNIYIGEVTREIPSYKERNIVKYQRWTDGGYYFSSYYKLLQIEEKIGCFHKGNKTIRYDHFIDGIELGEVGFPSEVHSAGLSFIGLPRSLYFIHDESKSKHKSLLIFKLFDKYTLLYLKN